MGSVGPDIQGAQTPLAHELEAVAERLRRSTVRVYGARRGGGSGVIWRSTGVIITNAHVVRGPSATVKLADDSLFEATVAARDPQRDLAVLKVEASDLPSATIRASSALRVGELVCAVGNPLGLVGALTVGIIHVLSPAEGAGGEGWIQADLHLAPGNSGGPLADAQGRVVGINSMVAGGLAFAVPSTTVEHFLNDGGQRPLLGVTLRRVSIPVQGEQILGLLVLGAEAGGAAEAAGMLLGDVLIGAAGRPFTHPEDLTRALRQAGAGERIRIDLIRGGQRLVCEVAVSASRRGVEAA